MKKTLAAFFCCLLTAGLFAAGAKDSKTEDIPIKVMAVDGAPILPLIKMWTDGAEVMRGYKISYQHLGGPDLLTASLMNQAPDFAIAPVNIAAVAHNNGSGYLLAAVNVWGIMHIVSNQNVKSLDDLKGGTIVAFGKAGTPGITLRAVLRQNSIKFVEDMGTAYSVPPDTIHIIYLAEAINVREAIIAGRLDNLNVRFGLLAEPVATVIAGATQNSAHGQFTARINLQDEWARNNSGEIYPQATLIFHQRLLGKHRDFVDKFIAAAELSSQYAQSNPLAVGNLAAARDGLVRSNAIPNGAVVANAVNAGRLPLDFTAAAGAKNAINAYLRAIYDDSPSSRNLIGGRIPSGSFYYDWKP